MTSGDAQRLGVLSQPNFLKLGEKRFSESVRALRFLGLQEEKISLLGYPDRGLAALWLDYWSETDQFSSWYSQVDRVPYAQALSPQATYNAKSLINDLKKIFVKFCPTKLYLPHPNDLNGDHWAANAFVLYTLEELKRSTTRFSAAQTELFTYLIHRNYWPLPRGQQMHRTLEPPKSIQRLDTNWESVPLSLEQTRKKYDAIRFYKTQSKLTDSHLATFARRNELFGMIPELSFATNQRDKKDNSITIRDLKTQSVLSHLRGYDGIEQIQIVKAQERLKVRVKLYKRLRSSFELRLDIKVIDQRHGSIRLQTKGNLVCLDQQALSADFNLKRNEYSWELEVPSKLFGGARRIIFGALVYQFDTQIGKSAHRVLELS
jgi:LmbE family N-acetylglucosaminyl deacetylase